MIADSEIQTISNEVAAKFAIYSLLSANCYHKPESKRITFPVKELGWQLVDLEGNPTNQASKVIKSSGLAYDIYKQDAADDVIFAFRGTEDYKDFLWANFTIPPFNVQYKQALKAVETCIAKYGNKDIGHGNIVVTGHSLGGGLALCASVHYGLRAVIFNPSPRVFDGSGNHQEEAERIVFFERGEILDIVRKIWRKDNEVIKSRNIYLCDYGFGTGAMTKHRVDLLALGILIQGAKVDASLKRTLDLTMAGLGIPKDQLGKLMDLMAQ